MAKTLKTGSFSDADLMQVRDSNIKMIADTAQQGAPIYKRHRVYRKALPDSSGSGTKPLG